MAKTAVRFKDTVATYERVREDIRERRFAAVYLLMGEESYFIDSLSDMLSESILPEADRAFSQYVVYGRDVNSGKVITLCRQLPMMGSYQVVVVKEAQQMERFEQLSLYAEHPSSQTILVLCYKGKSVDKRSSLYKWVAKSGVVLESVRPYDSEILGWLEGFVKQRGCTIEQKALQMLTEHLGTDISKISNELDKLLLSLDRGVTRITDLHVEQNIGISREFNNFELTKAVLFRDMKRALSIADHFARNPKDNPTLLTVVALFTQFRQLFLVNYLMWQSRHKGVPMPQDQELMRVARINNFYALSDIKRATSLWPNKRVFAVLGLLREYDAKSKGLGAGSISDGELRRELLLKIFLL